ncbi:MAG: hypothetical protein IPP07_30420 [Holophagales bacterium]|nr:hypothetical protein [Holophagales bacterium]
MRISGAFLLALAKMPPGDPMIVSVRDGRFHLGSMSTACVEQESWKSEISLPLDPSIVEILRLAFHYPPERVERAGLKKRVEEAQTRAAKILDLAAVTLAPLGITRSGPSRSASQEHALVGRQGAGARGQAPRPGTITPSFTNTCSRSRARDAAP